VPIHKVVFCSLKQDRTEAILTFSLCGFASFDSIGITLGALTAMIPERRHDLAVLVTRAMIVGNISSYLTACVAGEFIVIFIKH
jgi:nucleoside permease NupC